MSYARELLDDARGSVFLDLEGNALNFRVVMERRSGILVELSTEGGQDSEEAKLINAARLESNRRGHKLVVPVPNAVSIVSRRGGGVSFSNISVSGGMVQFGNGNFQVNSFGNGGVVIGRGRSGNTLVLEYGIGVTVYLPEGSDVQCLRGGGLEVSGHAGLIETDFSGGDIIFGDARELRLRTSGGDIEGDFVAERAQVRTSGGDINLGVTRGEVDLETSGGNVEIGEAYASGRMRTSGGNVKLGSFYGDSMSMTTSGGNIRHPEHPGITARTSGGRINGRSPRW